MCVLNVLVVDDDRDAAISNAASTDHDLVLRDVVLPVMNGFEARSAIQRADPSARVILMSGYWGASLEDTALDEDAVDVIPKPIDLDALTGRMEDISCEWHSAPDIA